MFPPKMKDDFSSKETKNDMSPSMDKIKECRQCGKSAIIRSNNGQFCKQCRKVKNAEYRKRSLKKYPWAKSYCNSKSRETSLGIKHTMRTADFKELWFRDKAWLLKKASIDRIDPTKGYIKENCRYIERSENCGMARKGKKFKYKPRFGGRIPINQYTKEGKFIRAWSGVVEVQQKFGEAFITIHRNLAGNCKTSRGFVWKRA